MFNSTWNASFTEKNIVSTFAKTGIFAYNPSVILDKITYPEPVLELIIQEKIPVACVSIWRIHKAYQRSLTAKRLGFIFHSNIQLVAQHSIDLYTISGLIKSLKEEKKKRSHGKRLNLCGDENVGAQFYSPCIVRRAIAYSDKKKAEEQADRNWIEAKKITAAANKVRKAEEKAQRALNAIKRHRITAEKKRQHAIDVQAWKELRTTAKITGTSRIPPIKIVKLAWKPRATTRKSAEGLVMVPDDGEVLQVRLTTTRGRTTMRTVQGLK